MPGVVISTAVRTGPVTPTTSESSQAFFVGLASRGPVDAAVKVTGLEDFEQYFGGYASFSFLHPTVETFFEEGGTQCWIARVVGSGADAATFSVVDVADDTCIELTANGPGTWGNDLAVQVADGTATSTKVVRLYLDGELLMSTGNVLTAAQAIGKINSHPVASKYVVASEGESALAPDTLALVDGEFSGGADDNTVSPANMVAGLALFNDAYGAGAVSCPETYSDSSDNDIVRSGLIAHANNYNRIALLHGASGATQSQIKTLAQDLSNEESAEHAALYYPWVYTPTAVLGVNRLIPPDGYVAGKRAAAHNSAGGHVPYAGLMSRALWVNGVVTDLDKAAGDALDDEGVNAIRVVQNTVRIYGARSLSADTTNFRYINAQDVINSIVTEAYRALEPVVFQTINGRNSVFASVEAKLIAVLEAQRVAGALYEAFDVNGRRVDFGYTVKCDASLNPVSQLATGLVKAKVGVRVSSIGDKIEVEIVKSNLTTSVV